MYNYWLDLIKREEEIEKIRKEEELRQLESIIKDANVRKRLKALWDSQRDQRTKKV
jgi:hypothetical protein